MDTEAEMSSRGSLDEDPRRAPVPGTKADNYDMKRMGKVQELNVSCV